jgi:hypothetical protein
LPLPIKSNRQREKTKVQRLREYKRLKEIETALAVERKKATQIQKNGKTFKNEDTANLPERKKGESRQRAADAVGLKSRTAEKGLAVLNRAEAGDTEAQEALDRIDRNELSVDRAYREISGKTKDIDEDNRDIVAMGASIPNSIPLRLALPNRGILPTRSSHWGMQSRMPAARCSDHGRPRLSRTYRAIRMWKAFLDESGIHYDSQACVVAGYWGKIGPWRKFDSAWRVALGRFGLPLDQFHAKEFIQRNGVFHRWDDEKTADFSASIGRLVSESRIHPVCYGLFREDFYSFSLAERKFLTGGSWHSEERRFVNLGNPDRPYFVAFTECLKCIASHLPAVGRVQLFVGTDRPVAKYAIALLRWLKLRTKRKRALGIVVASKYSTDKFGGIYAPPAKETPNLQVADLFAYLTYRHMIDRKASGDWATPPSGLGLDLLRNRKDPTDTSYRNAQLMRDMISVVPNLPGD